MRQSNAFIAIVILITLPVLYYFGFSVFAPTTPIVNAGATPLEMTPLEQPTLTFGSPSIGPKDAPVTIFSFGDYQCPACADLDATLAQVYESYKTKVRVIWKDMPNGSAHPESLNAAVAARCADEQGGFWPYHNLLMKSQNGLNDNNYPIFAQQLGLDATSFSDCYTTKRTKPMVERDVTEGLRLRIDATPFLFINGRRVSGAIDAEQMHGLIDAALTQAATPTTSGTTATTPGVNATK